MLLALSVTMRHTERVADLRWPSLPAHGSAQRNPDYGFIAVICLAQVAFDAHGKMSPEPEASAGAVRPAALRYREAAIGR